MTWARPWFFAILLAVAPDDDGHAEHLAGQAVTYADFNFVSYVTVSIDHVYFATSEGIIVYNCSRQSWEEPLTGTGGLNHRAISGIWTDVFGHTLIVETPTGYFEFNEHFEDWFPINDWRDLNNPTAHIPAPEMMFAPFGYVYPEAGALSDLHGRTFYFRDVVDDRSGNLWIGTWGHGPLRADAGSKTIEVLPYGLIQNRVNAISSDDRSLWISGALTDSYRSGITVFDPTANSFQHIESGLTPDFPAVDVNCLSVDDSLIYVGTPVGLLCLDRDGRQVRQRYTSRGGLIDNNVLSLGRNGDSLFVGTAYGLTMITTHPDSALAITPRHFLNHRIYDFDLVDSTMWVASAGGLYRFNLVTGALQRFRDPEAVLFGDVFAVEHAGDDLWAVSASGALKLNMKSAVQESHRFSVRRLTPYSLAVNDVIAAVATVDGMILLFHTADPPYTREFTVQDGLASNYVYSLLLDGDFIWVGTDRGLTRFLWNNPQRID